MLGAVISIPRLQTQARTEALLERSSSGGITFQIDSSATAHGSSIAERIVFIYGNVHHLSEIGRLHPERA